ncbi:D-2-hydroxyacid dehydrogenase [Desulfonatronum sp. SC1]|uniref:D-2-hydroxyacid dehydrogenase n=1 Tax=Desulfonatronum sp. SC1 TaxID=2109626 RepID=UPI000D3032A8|nr:D-2-hydroxyacid dehydrogenase [Desulfonatronum sp. SC1]PTN33330.1 glycerate dehydrogenase [Desulfonatronum sp. SC1]
MNIVVLDGKTINPGDNPWTPLETLGALTVHDRTAAKDILPRALSADILLTNKTPLRADTLAKLDKLRFIAVMATGYDVVDLDAASRRGIPVSNVPSYAAQSVAQFVLALILEHCHQVALHDREVRAGEWTKARDFCFWKTPQIELSGLIMGIIGFGRTGRLVAELAHTLGMDIQVYTPRIRETPSYKPFAWKALEDVFAEADVISLHCPLKPDNVGFVDKTLLARMKKSAFFINTSRGALVSESDLAEALNSGALAGAAVDVVSEEPIRPDNPLLSAKNCLITPHMAWASLSSRKRLLEATVENIKAFLSGRPTNVVNQPVSSE